MGRSAERARPRLTSAGLALALLWGVGCGGPAPTPPAAAPRPLPRPPVAFSPRTATINPYGGTPAIEPRRAPAAPVTADAAALRARRDQLAAALPIIDAARETAAFEAARARSDFLGLLVRTDIAPEALPALRDSKDHRFASEFVETNYRRRMQEQRLSSAIPIIEDLYDPAWLAVDARLRLDHLPRERAAVEAAIAALDDELARIDDDQPPTLGASAAEAYLFEWMLRPGDPGRPMAEALAAFWESVPASLRDLRLIGPAVAADLPPWPASGASIPEPDLIYQPERRNWLDSRLVAVRGQEAPAVVRSRYWQPIDATDEFARTQATRIAERGEPVGGLLA